MSAIEHDESAVVADGEASVAGIRITDDQIDTWRARLQEIDARLLELDNEKTRIQRKLAAVAELEDGSEPAMDDAVALAAAIRSPDHGIRLIDAIPLVVRKFKRPLTPKQIKSGLPDVGFSQPFGNNYFYTALKRAVEKKVVVRTHDKRYAPPDQDIIGVGINAGSHAQ